MSGLVGQILDHYRLVELIGQGGMATVYRALDTRSLEDVAIKILSSTAVGDRRFVRRFRREAGLVKNVLKHPHIVGVLDYNEVRNLVYLVMPFVPGETLHDRMARRRIGDADAARWIGQVAEALDFAHRHGIIHRDIKPSNILIDSNGDAHLTDFGLARLIEGSNTLTGSMLMGTPSYVSPEQGRGKRVDGRSDMYSLGVVMYQLAAGRVPFEGNTPMATVLMHLQEPVPRPSRFNTNLSPAIEKVILRALAKNPDERYPTVAALNQAYQAAMKGAPQADVEWLRLGGRPAPVAVAGRTTERRERARRSPILWAALGAVLALVVVGGVAVTALSALGAAIVETPLPTSPANPTAPPPPTLPAPQATPTPIGSADCPGIRLLGFRQEGSEVSWTIDNGTAAAVRITGVSFAVPLDNHLEDVQMGGVSIWSNATGGLTAAAADHAVLQPGSTSVIRMRYTWPDDRSGYRVGLTFDVGCSLDAPW